MLQTISNPGFAIGIFSRYAILAPKNDASASILLLTPTTAIGGIEAEPPVYHNAYNVSLLEQYMQHTSNLYTVNMNFSFLESMLTKVAREVGETTIRQINMLSKNDTHTILNEANHKSNKGAMATATATAKARTNQAGNLRAAQMIPQGTAGLRAAQLTTPQGSANLLTAQIAPQGAASSLTAQLTLQGQANTQTVFNQGADSANVINMVHPIQSDNVVETDTAKSSEARRSNPQDKRIGANPPVEGQSAPTKSANSAEMLKDKLKDKSEASILVTSTNVANSASTAVTTNSLNVTSTSTTSSAINTTGFIKNLIEKTINVPIWHRQLLRLSEDAASSVVGNRARPAHSSGMNSNLIAAASIVLPISHDIEQQKSGDSNAAQSAVNSLKRSRTDTTSAIRPIKFSFSRATENASRGDSDERKISGEKRLVNTTKPAIAIHSPLENVIRHIDIKGTAEKLKPQAKSSYLPQEMSHVSSELVGNIAQESIGAQTQNKPEATKSPKATIEKPMLQAIQEKIDASANSQTMTDKTARSIKQIMLKHIFPLANNVEMKKSILQAIQAPRLLAETQIQENVHTSPTYPEQASSDDSIIKVSQDRQASHLAVEPQVRKSTDMRLAYPEQASSDDSIINVSQDRQASHLAVEPQALKNTDMRFNYPVQTSIEANSNQSRASHDVTLPRSVAQVQQNASMQLIYSEDISGTDAAGYPKSSDSGLKTESASHVRKIQLPVSRLAGQTAALGKNNPAIVTNKVSNQAHDGASIIYKSEFASQPEKQPRQDRKKESLDTEVDIQKIRKLVKSSQSTVVNTAINSPTSLNSKVVNGVARTLNLGTNANPNINIEEQASAIADKVYGIIERRLHSERLRKGMF